MSVLRKVFNHHKMKRQLGWQFKRSRSKVKSIMGTDRHAKDFSWHGTNANPYLVHDKEDKRIFLYVVILCVSILGIFIFAVYSSAFTINRITIGGLERISDNEMRNAVHGILDFEILGILPKRGYFLADAEEIKNILMNRFPIEHVVVQKRFPDKLNILVQEKISQVIYDNGKTYCYMDVEGKVVEIIRSVSQYEWDEKTKTTTSTDALGNEINTTEVIERNHKPDTLSVVKEMGNYPVIYDKRHPTIELGATPLTSDRVREVVDWFNNLRDKKWSTLSYVSIENEDNIYLHMRQGSWYIKTRSGRSVDQQISEIETLINQKIFDLNSLEYIDTRYSDRIYWQ
ncbi:MAG: FtsQ-type POTRA domain-containing protein [Candidatus Magasanikbacteria bacterium]